MPDEVADAPPQIVPVNGPLYALSFRNFRLFVTGQLISLAGTWMQQVAEQWLVFSLTHSAFWLGIIIGASALPAVTLSLVGGHLADRYPRRNILILTQFAALLQATVLTLLATNRWVQIQPWHIATLAAVMGVINAFNTPAQQAFVSEMVEDKKALGNAIALNSIMFNTARFLGPILAGLALVRFGAAACFGVNAVSYIAVIISLYMIRVPHREPTQHRQSVWEGFRFIWSVRSVFRTITMVGVAGFFIWSISTLYPVFATDFKQGASGYTVIMTVNGIGAALGGIFVATMGERLERRFLVYGAPVVFCSAFIALSFTQTYYTALFWIFIAGFAMITLGVSAQTKVQQDVPDVLRGRTMAVYSLVFSGTMPLGGLLVGFLSERMSAFTTVRISGILCLIVALSLFAWSQYDRTVTPAEIDK